MRLSLKLAVSIIFMLSLSVVVSANEWHGIVPLHSTRADVEQLLGHPIDNPPNKNSDNEKYKTEDRIVIILYSDGQCRVPKDTVLTIIVRTAPFAFSELKLDKSRFVEKTGGDVANLSQFTNEEDGMSYEVSWKGKPTGEQREGLVTSVEYYPSSKDKQLLCSESSHRPNR
jgi:hypothetical protein